MAASKPKVLVILTSVNKVPKTGKVIGWYLPELAHPWHVLHSKVDLTIASPKGGEAPIDPISVEFFKEDEVCMDFYNNHSDVWKNTVKLSELAGRASEFDAVFYPGGHGPMFDLAFDETSLDLIRDFHAQDKPISAVCHGPAALVNAKTASGEPLVKGKEVTGFDNAGETMFGFDGELDFSLEDQLNEISGGKFVKSPEGPMGEKVVVDGKLITGQNPASSYGVGNAILKALGL